MKNCLCNTNPVNGQTDTNITSLTEVMNTLLDSARIHGGAGRYLSVSTPVYEVTLTLFRLTQPVALHSTSVVPFMLTATDL